jgi:clan AA aspartic protease (TIGR02281 family)
MKVFLGFALLLSLALNAYLLWHQGLAKPLTQEESISAEVYRDARSEALKNTPNSDAISVASKQSEQAVQDPLKVPQEGITLDFLRGLKQANEYERLAFYVQTYLRQYPQDTDALLLEAEAFYYTEPLNAALLNYYALRDQNLTREQLESINKIIDVNTTRIIQQFSGDGTWDLLATFLEPLIQVDPLNRRYLMALATAYGMQQQTILMENILASLPADDQRAQRLRDNIYGREQPEPELASNTNNTPRDYSNRRRSVPLTERNGQYYTRVALSGVNALLLVDTGASTTAISAQVFAQIDSDDTAYLGNFNVQTAGGMISSPIYRIASFQIGSETLKNISVMILPTENMRNFDGLLGINVIRSFNVEYDPTIGTMRMFKKEG